jgi:hypothetical protein
MTPADPIFRFWRVRHGRLTGISRRSDLRQTWGPGVNVATTRCSVDPRHTPPEPRCLCGMYVLPDLATTLGYLRRTTLGREPSTPVVVGSVRPLGPAYRAHPWPWGDPAATLRIGAPELLGPLHLWPGDEALRTSLADFYGVPVLRTKPGRAFRDWLDDLGHLAEVTSTA